MRRVNCRDQTRHCWRSRLGDTLTPNPQVERPLLLSSLLQRTMSLDDPMCRSIEFPLRWGRVVLHTLLQITAVIRSPVKQCWNQQGGCAEPIFR